MRTPLLASVVALLIALSAQAAYADNPQSAQDIVLRPCPNLPVPYFVPVIPSGCFAWYYADRNVGLTYAINPDPNTVAEPDWTLAQQFVASSTYPVNGINLVGVCGYNSLSGDCDPQDTVTVILYGLTNGFPSMPLATTTLPAQLWPAAPPNGCPNFGLCSGAVFVAFPYPPMLTAGTSYAIALSSRAGGGFAFGTQVFTVAGVPPIPDIGVGPLLGQVDYGNPSTAATPELDSILLFGSGLTGMAGYALLRLRAKH